MIYQITKVKYSPSKQGGHFYYIFFKDQDGNSLKTCTGPKFRNFSNWKPFIERFVQQRVNVYLSNLSLKSAKLINADSQPREESANAFNGHMAIRETQGENPGANA